MMLATLRYMLAHEYWYWAICAACVVLFTLVLRVHVALVPLIERLASHLEDDDGQDAIVANRRLRALKTGMQFMEYASDPKSSLRAAKKAVKRINKRRQILKRTEPGTGLHHLHSRPDQRPWPTPEISYFSDVSDGGVPQHVQASSWQRQSVRHEAPCHTCAQRGRQCKPWASQPASKLVTTTHLPAHVYKCTGNSSRCPTAVWRRMCRGRA